MRYSNDLKSINPPQIFVVTLADFPTVGKSFIMTTGGFSRMGACQSIGRIPHSGIGRILYFGRKDTVLFALACFGWSLASKRKE